MNKFFTNFFQQILLGLFLVCFYFPAHSQNVVDINVAGAKNLQAQESNNPLVKQMFNDADRYRPFDYNKQLSNLSSKNIGDVLLLNFFEDKKYDAVIQQVSTTLKGRTSITSKIANDEFAYCYMVVSENTISISAELPKEDLYFFASVKDGQAFLTQVKKSQLDKTALASIDDAITVPHQKSQNIEYKVGTKDIDDIVVIDVLFVYTPAAEAWALNDWRVTDIHDVIDQALQRANTTMLNSETGITFYSVYEHLTDYVESNTYQDLYRITDPYDGYMDEVHVLRDEYFADEIVFLPAVDFTGGVAWLLNNEDGFELDNYAVALCRVQQTSWTYTAVHEIGHNMGCGHHAEQTTQQGPGLFYFSSGWRGIINNMKVSTVMTYESGSYFYDGETHPDIPYFSSPEIFINGVQIGDNVTADNALTLKITKTPVSNYRLRPVTNPQLIINPSSLNFTNAPYGTTTTPKFISVSGENFYSNITYTVGGNDAASFTITPVSWNPALGGTISVTFTPTEVKEYHAYITFTCPDTESKVVSLNGNGALPYTISATTSGRGTITPSGNVIVGQGESKRFAFYPDGGYEIIKVLVNNVPLPEPSALRSYSFVDIQGDSTIHIIFSGVGIHENVFDNVKIYSHLNNIIIQNEGEITLMFVEIFDMMGQLIYQNNITETKTVIPLQVSNGIYNVRLCSQEGNMIIRKVAVLKQ